MEVFPIDKQSNSSMKSAEEYSGYKTEEVLTAWSG